MLYIWVVLMRIMQKGNDYGGDEEANKNDNLKFVENSDCLVRSSEQSELENLNSDCSIR